MTIIYISIKPEGKWKKKNINSEEIKEPLPQRRQLGEVPSEKSAGGDWSPMVVFKRNSLDFS